MTGDKHFDEMQTIAKTAMSLAENAMAQLKRIADALGTEERGEALVEIARNAHRAEQKLAAFERDLNSPSFYAVDLFPLVNKHFPIPKD